MSKLNAITKWFFLYNKNILELLKFENKSGKKVVLYAIEKNSISDGRIEEKLVIDVSKIEAWKTPDLIWESRQYGHWNRVFVQNIKDLCVLEKTKHYDKDLKSNLIILTCSFGSFESFTKYDNDWNKNSKWNDTDEGFVELPVMYNVSDSSKPAQSFLVPEDLEKFNKV